MIHDPHDRQQLSYLAASAEGRPIYLNRTLYDAELVIPVNCLTLIRQYGSLHCATMQLPAGVLGTADD